MKRPPLRPDAEAFFGESSRTVLLVILGAGASHDSVDDLSSFGEENVRNYCPPLAQELLDSRPMFGNVLEEFPQCAALVGALRRRIEEGALLETEFELSRDEATRYPPRHRQLAAIRFYLQFILWRCAEAWQQLSSGITNYAMLVDRLDRWRHDAGEQVCVVTFNYDHLLDRAVEGTLGIPLNTVAGYVASDTFKVLKLHGSVNWARVAQSLDGTSYSKADHARRVIIDAAESLRFTGDYQVRPPEENPSLSDGKVLFPAIAIPVEKKSEFECPPAHLEALDSALPEVLRILIVGWRATEQHFLERLHRLPGMAPRIEIVGLDEAGIRETQNNLEAFGLAPETMRAAEGGFTRYLKSARLEEFLSTD